MAILSSIFGGNDSYSSNDSSGSNDLIGNISSTLGLDFDSSQSNYDADEDGNVTYSTNDNSLGLDLDTDGLLGNLTDFMSSNEQYSD